MTPVHPDQFSANGRRASEDPAFGLGYVVTMLEQRIREHDLCREERLGVEKDLYERQGKVEVAVARADGVAEGTRQGKVRLSDSNNFRPTKKSIFLASLSWQDALKGTVIIAILIAGVITGIIVGYHESVKEKEAKPISTGENK